MIVCSMIFVSFVCVWHMLVAYVVEPCICIYVMDACGSCVAVRVTIWGCMVLCVVD
jgi:hypothetical protein